MNHSEVRAMCEKNGIHAIANAQPWSPAIKPEYVFRKEHVIEMIGFIVMGDIAMKLIGPAGCGKTTLVEQFHAALNWPLLQPAVHAQMEASDLNGQLLPTDEGFKYVYGHLINAARNGISVFLDEYNVLRAATTTSLNPLLEGGKIDIPETGETIVPKPGFRVFAAHNPNDRGLGYHGRNEMDVSNQERFWTVEVGYPMETEEQPIVKAVLSEVFDDATADAYATKMVEVANRIRSQYMGNSQSADALEVTMSTRTLTRWARALGVFSNTSNPVIFTLKRALTNSTSPESAEAIHAIVEDVFGLKTAKA